MEKILKIILLAVILQKIVQSASLTEPNRVFCHYDIETPETCVIENYSTKSKDEGSTIIDLFTENTYELKIQLVNSSIGTLDNFLCNSFKYINVIDFSASGTEITEIDSNALKFCRGVAKVDLSRNSIQDIDRETFKYTRQLRHIDISFNNIDYLDSRVFAHTKKLEFLDLGNNNLKYLQAAVFKPVLNTLVVLNIQNNRLLGVENLDNIYRKVSDVVFEANYFLCTDAIFEANLIMNLSDMGCLDESSWLEMVSKVIEHDNADVPHELKQKYLKIKVEYTGRLYEKKIENTRAELLEQVSAKAESLKEWFQNKLMQSIEEKSKELNVDINQKWEHLTIEFNQDNQDIEKRMKELVVYETVEETESEEEEADFGKPEIRIDEVTFADRFDEVMGHVTEWSKVATEWSKVAWKSITDLF